MTAKTKHPIDLNPQFKAAYEAMESDAPFVFVTGRAGTGKSTLLRYFRERTRKACAYLAPTGVAALNIDGQTVHSFFLFAPGITVEKAKKKGSNADDDLYREIETIVVDEVSMVRADLMDCMDAFLKRARRSRKPFGGLQLITIGDLYQLPPVVTRDEHEAFGSRYVSPYFFSSDVVECLAEEGKIEFIELEKVYRQRDENFIHLLNGVRNASIDEDDLARLNSRVHAHQTHWQGAFIHLTPTNAAADAINVSKLATLKHKERIYHGSVNGTFGERDLPTDARLVLKSGARVMFVKNDPSGRWVNGSMGSVCEMKTGKVDVCIDGDEGRVTVEPVTWMMYRSVYDPASRLLEQEKVGSFTQIPLRLAWATTIHKSQGKTFDRVLVDLGRGAFASGQVYVALSRATSFEGLILTKPVTRGQLRLDYRIMRFMTGVQYRRASETLSSDEKLRMLREAIRSGRRLEMTYLKAKDEKSCRQITPLRLYESEFKGHPFLALDAHCHLRDGERVFNVERILSLKMV